MGMSVSQKTWLVRGLIAVLVLYVMSHMPGPAAFLLFPFETAWTHARAGELRPGDPAPDFDLLKLDKSARVHLSTLTAQQPVVLVFGSYT
jgi:hypothetical protein